MAKIINPAKFHEILMAGIHKEGSAAKFCKASKMAYPTFLGHLRTLESEEPLTSINTKVLKKYHAYFGDTIFEAIKIPSSMYVPNVEPVGEALHLEYSDDERQDILYEIIARQARIEAKLDQLLTNQEKDLWIS